jgi:hypothetical protein
MFFSNNYIQFSTDLDLHNNKHNICIMSSFVKKYIDKKNNEYEDKQSLYKDAIIYSKYYLYYKNLNCIYGVHIMNILLYIEK